MTVDGSSAHSHEPEGVRLPPPSRRYLSLDLWRGLACLIVVINHAALPLCSEVGLPPEEVTRARVLAQESSEKSGPLDRIPKMLVKLTTKMFFGVEMFFVISGYCITASAESLRRSGGTMGEYFRRRFIRIYPPFWCALLFSVAFCFTTNWIFPGLISQAPWPLNVPQDLSLAQWLGCLTLSSTWIGYLTGEPKMLFPIQSWTLCYEEQFYAVVGLLFVLCGNRFFRAVSVLTGAIVVLDVAAIFFGFPIHGFFCDEYWFMFAAGVGVYWTLNCASIRQGRVFQGCLVAVSCLLVWLSLKTSLFGNESHFSAWRTVGAFAFALTLILLKPYDQKIAGSPWLGWLKNCGLMSYSIYLIHLFPGKVIGQLMRVRGYRDDLSILLICIPLALAAAVSLGYVFHRLVERQFLPLRIDGLPLTSTHRQRLSHVSAQVAARLPEGVLPLEQAGAARFDGQDEASPERSAADRKVA